MIHLALSIMIQDAQNDAKNTLMMRELCENILFSGDKCVPLHPTDGYSEADVLDAKCS